MNEQNKNSFEPPVMTVLSDTFNQDGFGNSVQTFWDIKSIPDVNK